MVEERKSGELRSADPRASPVLSPPEPSSAAALSDEGSDGT